MVTLHGCEKQNQPHTRRFTFSDLLEITSPLRCSVSVNYNTDLHSLVRQVLQFWFSMFHSPSSPVQEGELLLDLKKKRKI